MLATLPLRIPTNDIVKCYRNESKQNVNNNFTKSKNESGGNCRCNYRWPEELTVSSGNCEKMINIDCNVQSLSETWLSKRIME